MLAKNFVEEMPEFFRQKKLVVYRKIVLGLSMGKLRITFFSLAMVAFV